MSEPTRTWDEMVAEAKAAGGVVIAPNDLPIASLRYDNAMLEHEHADHVDYVFPVEAEYTGKRISLPELDDDRYANCSHALIYASGNVALTIYECTYAMWVRGELVGANLFEAGSWKLSEESMQKIRAYVASKGGA